MVNESDIRPEWDDLSPWQPAPPWVGLLVDLMGLVVVGLAAFSVWGR